MSAFRVLSIVGTRPEIIRLSRVLSALDAHFDHTLVHTGQNYDYELNDIFFRDLELKQPSVFLGAVGKNAAETIGNTLIKIDPILEKTDPHALLVLGDTNSCLSVIAAKRKKIPIFHMEAGNRCFDWRVPEEINRRIVDHVSDINLPYSDLARENLLREGIAPERIIKTGSPMFEVLNFYKTRIADSDVLNRLKLAQQDYFVVSMHREENVDSPSQFERLIVSLDAIAQKYGKRIIFSAHPRTRKRLEERNIRFSGRVEISKPMGLLDYVSLQKNALAVLSDSGTITEESSILNFPAVNIRESHERPEGMEEASVPLSGTSPDSILRCLELVTGQPRGNDRAFRLPADYTAPNVSEKVVRIIASYTDYVNRVVWRR